MFIQWLTDNWANILIVVLILSALVLVVCKLIKDKKNGKSSCGCGCENCAMHDSCHKKDKL